MQGDNEKKLTNAVVENGCLAVPAGVTCLDRKSLSGVPEMDELVIPEGITRIVGGAFIGCGARRVVIPSSVRFISWPGPEDAPALEEIDLRCRATAGYCPIFPHQFPYRFTRNGKPLPFRDWAYIQGRLLFVLDGRAWPDDRGYLEDAEFRGLVRRASCGDAQGMRLLAEYYERLAQGEFSRVCANFWRYYAMLHGDGPSEMYWAEWVREHPQEKAPIGPMLRRWSHSSLQELRCCGFALPADSGEYAMPGLQDGVWRIDIPDGHIDADEDGFGYEELYQHVYADEYLRLIPDLKRYPEAADMPGDELPLGMACRSEEDAVHYVRRMAGERGYVFV